MPLKVAIRIGPNVFEAEGEFKAEGDFTFDAEFIVALQLWLDALHDNRLPDGATGKLDELIAQGQELMMASTEVTAILNRIETAGTNIAADVRGLKDDVNVGMTAAEVAAVKAHAERIAVAMEALAAETPDGPPAPPAPPAA